MSREADELRREMTAMRREMADMRRMIKLIRPHLFQEEDSTSGGSGNLIQVNVTQTGGSAGTRTAECSFTYTVRTVDGTVIGTGIGISGHGARVVKAAMLAGTVGIAYWPGSGTPTLLWVDERLTQNNC